MTRPAPNTIRQTPPKKSTVFLISLSSSSEICFSGRYNALAIFDSFLYRFNFFRREEEAVPRLTEHAQVESRIVLDEHGEVRPAFVILLDAVDDRNLSGEGQIENVAALAREQAHAAAGAHLNAVHFHSFQREPFFEETPVQFVHGVLVT